VPDRRFALGSASHHLLGSSRFVIIHCKSAEAALLSARSLIQILSLIHYSVEFVAMASIALDLYPPTRTRPVHTDCRFMGDGVFSRVHARPVHQKCVTFPVHSQSGRPLTQICAQSFTVSSRSVSPSVTRNSANSVLATNRFE
jgi:hypothetical protein